MAKWYTRDTQNVVGASSCEFESHLRHLKKRKRKILVIVGPTSSGKSALAVELARKFNGEVISADSRQVYKGLNIGTGKITKREMRGVRHHLLDVASPKKTLTAHDFVQKARQAIEEIARREKLPIIAGGTGFYIDALVGRIVLPDVPANQKLRARLEKKTAGDLFVLLKRRDPRRAHTIDRHNKRRLIRALEIVHALGEVPSHRGFVNPNSPYSGLRNPNILWVGLILPRTALTTKIRTRLLARIRQGMVAEARRLHKAGLTYHRMEQLGLEYRALAHYLQGKVSRVEMIDELDRDIHRYAKRQLTYWRSNKQIRWFAPDERKNIVRLVQTFCGR